MLIPLHYISSLFLYYQDKYSQNCQSCWISCTFAKIQLDPLGAIKIICIFTIIFTPNLNNYSHPLLETFASINGWIVECMRGGLDSTGCPFHSTVINPLLDIFLSLLPWQIFYFMVCLAAMYINWINVLSSIMESFIYCYSSTMQFFSVYLKKEFEFITVFSNYD